MNDINPFGPGGIAFIALYLLSLVGIGYVGYRARRGDSLQDFYLAGPGIGFITLLLTLYATQYSGNTLFGFTGKTYRMGFSWAMCIHFMTAIVVVYLLFAPQLYRRAKAGGYVTPTDYLTDRFGSRGLSVFASVLMIVAISNYLLAQLMAMGRALQGLTTADPYQAYVWGVIFLALIIVIYETLGGFRAVAWTDVIQGTVLLVGFLVLVGMVFATYGSLGAAVDKIAADPAQADKVQPPGAAVSREWFSYIVLVGLGGALYPQAVQRIYAARSGKTLRRSLQVMAFLPLTTTLVAVLVGIVGLAYIPGLITIEGGETVDRADTVLTVICREIQEQSTFGYWLVVILFAGILAAIMSTADSVLLSMSSMITKDLYAPLLRPAASEKELMRVGKVSSWALIVIAVILAIALRGTTLVKLLDRKFDLLVQLAPAFLLGIHWKGMRSGPTLWGMAAGAALAIGLALAGMGKPAGIHAGLYGLALNATISVGGSLLMGGRGSGGRGSGGAR